MAAAKTVTHDVKVVEINEGTKIDYEQNGTRLTFDDQLMINVAKYQKAWPVHIDITMDADRNLCNGTATGLFYVAQLDIPEIKYEEPVEVEEGEEQPAPVVIPLDMADVTLTLWAIDRPTPSVEE